MSYDEVKRKRGDRHPGNGIAPPPPPPKPPSSSYADKLEEENEVLKAKIADAIVDLQEIVRIGRNPVSGYAKVVIGKLR